MQQRLLELLYEKEFKGIKILPRKLSLYKESKILLCGPRGSGKSMLIRDFLSNEAFGSYLYIDFDDFRVDKIDRDILQNFIEEKKITTLVLENFDFSFTPPPTLKIIITATKKKELDGFVTKILYPLDFEEFLLFEKRFVNEQIAFNNFSLMGSYPFVVESGREFYEHRFHLFLNSLFDNKTKFFIFKMLSLKQSSFITPLSLFKEIKEYIKISKDRFYAILKELQEEMFIYLVPKYKQRSHEKKIYMIDFAIRGVISYEKDFTKRLENIIFTELLKKEEEIYCDTNFDFILPKKQIAIISMPFLPEGLLKNRLKLLSHQAKKLNIFNIKVITLDPQFIFKYDGVSFEVLNFWNFSLQE